MSKLCLFVYKGNGWEKYDEESMLTERQIREKNYYEKFAQNFNPNANVDLSPVIGPLTNQERRPWNSYWRTYEMSVDFYSTKYNQTPVTLLDFGCGPGDNALRFSHIGYKVTGFDICEQNVKNCKTLFSLNETIEESSFIVSPAEEIALPDDSFDIVVGIDILHHVDIPKAMKEIKRVLRPNGIAIFREPIEVPLIDKMRNTKLFLHFFPNTPSFEHHITADERKLNYTDLKMIKKEFPDLIIERSLVLSRFDKFFRKFGDRKPSFLEKLDYKINKFFPLWQHLGGAAVIIIKKKTLMALIPLLPTLSLHHLL